MNVTFVINEYNFYLTHRKELINKISEKFSVNVITDLSDLPHSQLPNSNKQKIKFIHLAKRKQASKIGYLLYAKSLQKLISDNCSELEKIFFVSLETCFIASSISSFLKPRKLHFIIGGIGPYLLEANLRGLIIRKLYYFAFMGASKSTFIFQNRDDENLFHSMNFCFNQNSKVIEGNGINMNPEKDSKKAKQEKIIFSFAGRLVKSKGVCEFIDAAATIHKKFPKVRFIIAGEYNENDKDRIPRDYFHRIISQPYINYHGYIQHEKMNEFLSLADIFVLPSFREGMPMSALEAASLGMPLILANTPGCKECIEGNGFLVNPYSADDLANNMEKFIKNPELIKKFGIMSMVLVRKRFSLEKISNEYLKLINSV